jgi:hypothetical protein
MVFPWFSYGFPMVFPWKPPINNTNKNHGSGFGLASAWPFSGTKGAHPSIRPAAWHQRKICARYTSYSINRKKTIGKP